MAILDLQVSASTDDAYRQLSNDYWSLTLAQVQVGRYLSAYCRKGGGFRFQNVTLPKGSVITLAKIIATSNLGLSDANCNTEISAEDVDDAPTFADNKAAFDARYANHTTAQVNWDNIAAWTAENEYESPDIKDVIQEIIDRPGWESGNAIVIFWEDFDNESSDNGYRALYSYDGSSTKALKLHLEYEGPQDKTSSDSGAGADAIENLLAVMESSDDGKGLETMAIIFATKGVYPILGGHHIINWENDDQ